MATTTMTLENQTAPNSFKHTIKRGLAKPIISFIQQFPGGRKALKRLGMKLTQEFFGDGPVGAVNPTRTSATENWAGLPAITMSGTNFTAALPAQSVTTFTGNLWTLQLEATGFILEASDQLISTNCSTPTNAPVNNGTKMVVTMRAAAEARFYRAQEIDRNINANKRYQFSSTFHPKPAAVWPKWCGGGLKK